MGRRRMPPEEDLDAQRREEIHRRRSTRRYSMQEDFPDPIAAAHPEPRPTRKPTEAQLDREAQRRAIGRHRITIQSLERRVQIDPYLAEALERKRASLATREASL